MLIGTHHNLINFTNSSQSQDACGRQFLCRVHHSWASNEGSFENMIPTNNLYSRIWKITKAFIGNWRFLIFIQYYLNNTHDHCNHRYPIPTAKKVAVSKIALRSHQKRNQIQLPLFKNDNSALFQQKVNGIIWKTSTNGEYVCVCVFFFFFNNLFIYFSLFWIYLGVLNHVNVNFILAIWSPTYMI